MKCLRPDTCQRVLYTSTVHVNNCVQSYLRFKKLTLSYLITNDIVYTELNHKLSILLCKFRT